jgi:acetyltransferase-like isoleucine patch superfamily enzyme
MWISPSSAARMVGPLKELLIAHMPGPLGFELRWSYWKKRLKYLGDGALIETGVYFQNPQYIAIGENSWIDKNVIILAGLDRPGAGPQRERVMEQADERVTPGVVHIGRDVHVAPHCIISGIAGGVFISDRSSVAAASKLYALSHHYRSVKDPANRSIYFAPRVAQESQCVIQGSIFLGHNVGVAVHCVVLPGTTIEGDSFVAINSVVRGRFEANSLIAGNPAKRVKARFESRAARP